MTGLNAVCQAQFGKPLSLELLFGLVFQFVAYAIGVPWQRCAATSGSLMGIKLVLNEFVAYLRMADMVSARQLSEKAIVIATYALCGFANFSSIAIQIGGISPLAENRRGDIARLGLKAVLGGTIATWMTASIAGMFVAVIDLSTLTDRLMKETLRKKYRWFVLGDLNGFFGLMFDNLTVLSFLAGILIFVFKYPGGHRLHAHVPRHGVRRAVRRSRVHLDGVPPGEADRQTGRHRHAARARHSVHDRHRARRARPGVPRPEERGDERSATRR